MEEANSLAEKSEQLGNKQPPLPDKPKVFMGGGGWKNSTNETVIEAKIVELETSLIRKLEMLERHQKSVWETEADLNLARAKRNEITMSKLDDIGVLQLLSDPNKLEKLTRLLKEHNLS